MAGGSDGPFTKTFQPIPIQGNCTFDSLDPSDVSRIDPTAAEKLKPRSFVGWGIPFSVHRPVFVGDEPVTIKLPDLLAPWLVFCHTADRHPVEVNASGFRSPMRGEGGLGVVVAEYVFVYADGGEHRQSILRRHQIGAHGRRWGECCFECVPAHKPCPMPGRSEETTGNVCGRRFQTRANPADLPPWQNWLWAWKNPHPRKRLVAIRVEPGEGAVLISGVAAGKASSNPLRWRPRRKAVLRLPAGSQFDPQLDGEGLLGQIRLDMGQVISATPRPAYPDEQWGRSYNNKLPEISAREVLIEYAAHDDACFHLSGDKRVAVSRLDTVGAAGPLRGVASADRTVTVRVVEKSSGKPVPVKLHIHGEAGEYLPPVDRHRIPNPQWFEDYSVDFTHQGIHHCTYIDGVTTVKLPVGKAYVEVSKGFEIRPVRKVVRVGPRTDTIEIVLEKVLPWREAGWVTADTHVHFLSPESALLEGAGEGVNVVNLLASQWGELMTNVGDFDGRTTHGAIDTGGDGEHLVRVGTENRQHVLGHISLLGYEGRMISPMCSGGADEAAIGDPVDVLLTEWARQCRSRGGLVVLPHFPNPRGENAAVIVHGEADGVEMTAWSDLYSGIDPYSLSDWYRYLNCGYFVPAVAGTDKMLATTAIGTVRTYARIDRRKRFDYDAWMDAVRRGETFVTYGPLMEFSVEGKPAGSRIKMRRSGGTVDVEWSVATTTVPMTRVELVVNGEIRQSRAVKAGADEGSWSVKLDRSSWLALLVRGRYRDKPEMIAAHSSPVMVEVARQPFAAAADALTILEQIEGALAYLDTVGTRAETARYKQMRMVLTSAHRTLHNRMHQMNCYHEHTPVEDHPAHH